MKKYILIETSLNDSRILELYNKKPFNSKEEAYKMLNAEWPLHV